MTLVRLLDLIVVSCGIVVASAHGQTTDTREQDYALGLTLGDCLIRKCKIVEGALLAQAPKSGEPVQILVHANSPSGPTKLETSEVPFLNPGLPHSMDVGPGRAWKDISFSRNAPVTVVLAKEHVGVSNPGEPVVVTTDALKGERIHAILAEEARLTNSEEEISSAVASLSRDADAAMAGYLYAYLTRVEVTKNPDLCTALLSNLVKSPSVPPGAWRQIFMYLVLDYHLLSPKRKSAMVGEFTGFARDADPRLAAIAINAIGRLASNHEEIRLSLSVGDVGGIESAYRSLVRGGSVQRDPALEATLGITYQ